MKKIRVIPRLDIKGPNLVKGIQLEGVRVLGTPDSFAGYYYQNGADELVYMDVVASLYGRNSLTDIIERTAQKIFIPITVGGGLRSIEDIKKVLRVGADKVALNTAAVKNPDLINAAANEFGSSTVVVSIEAKAQENGTYEAYIDSGRERSGKDAFLWAVEAYERGAGEILLTSIDQEGTGKGFACDLVEEISRKIPIPVVASGGAGTPGDVVDVIKKSQADAVCIASMFHYDYLDKCSGKDIGVVPGKLGVQTLSNITHIGVRELKQKLSVSGIECREEEITYA